MVVMTCVRNEGRHVPFDAPFYSMLEPRPRQPVNSIRCGLTPQRIGCACSSSSATVVKVKLSGLDPFPFYCEDGTWPMPLVKFSASNLVTSIANLKVKVSFGVRMDAIVAVQ